MWKTSPKLCIATKTAGYRHVRVIWTQTTLATDTFQSDLNLDSSCYRHISEWSEPRQLLLQTHFKVIWTQTTPVTDTFQSNLDPRLFLFWNLWQFCLLVLVIFIFRTLSWMKSMIILFQLGVVGHNLPVIYQWFFVVVFSSATGNHFDCLSLFEEKH